MKKWSLPVIALACISCKSVPASVDAPQSDARRLTIMATNDFHGSLYEIPDSKNPGMALAGLPWYMGMIEQLKARPGHETLHLDAGDCFQGSMLVNASKGMGSIDVFNALKVDAAVIGNHEFDYGVGTGEFSRDLRGAIKQAMDASHFLWVSSNVHQDKELADPHSPWPPEKLRSWTMFEKAGARVAVIGLTTEDTRTTTVATNIPDLRFENPAAAVTRLMPEVLAAKPDYVILLGHLSGTCALPPARDGENCAFDGEIGEILALPDDILSHVSLMVTGHSHKHIMETNRNVLVVQNRAHAREVAQIPLLVKKRDNGVSVTFDPSAAPSHITIYHKAVDPGCTGAPYPKTELEVGGEKEAKYVVKPSEKAFAIMESLESRLKINRCQKLGCVTEPLIRSNEGEDAIGNFVTDTMSEIFPAADIAIQNSGGLRQDLIAEDIYTETILGVMPFENYVYLVKMKGSAVRDMFRISSSGKHGHLHVSGMSYGMDRGCRNPADLTRDGTIEPWENDCLCDIRVGGKALEDDKVYTVATNSFLYTGGDHMDNVFKDAQLIEEGPIFKEMLVDKLMRTKTCLKHSDYVKKDKPRITSCKMK